MAFKKGISGNPGGKSREKIFTDALRLELNRVDPNDKEKRKKVNRLAEKLVECAIEDKQAWAFQQIADRLEGKPVARRLLRATRSTLNVGHSTEAK